MKVTKIKTHVGTGLKICRAISAIFGEEIISIEQTFEGVFNQVYIIDLQKKKLVLKVFTSPDFPESQKTPWVNDLLQAHHIQHPELLYYSRKNDYFTYGCAVYEYIVGDNARQAIAAKKLTQIEFARNQAKLLKKIHAIKLTHYGFPTDHDLIEFMINPMLETMKDSLVHQYTLEDIITSSIEIVRKTITKYANRCCPVLTHGDSAPRNTIISAIQGNMLIDWDNCEGNIWLADYSYLLFWLENSKTDREQITAFKKAFFEGYGQPKDFSSSEIEEIASTLHIRLAVLLLPYFLNVRNDLLEFVSVKSLLISKVQARSSIQA